MVIWRSAGLRLGCDLPDFTRKRTLVASNHTGNWEVSEIARCKMPYETNQRFPASAGCNALNPLCGSARRAPIATSLSATAITFAEVQQGFVLTVKGSQFVSFSVAVINGTRLSTTVVSIQELQVTPARPSCRRQAIPGRRSASWICSGPSGHSKDRLFRT